MSDISKGYQMPQEPEPPQCAWPREYRELSLPLSRHHIGSIYLPVNMTEEEWEMAEQYLELMKASMLRRPPSVARSSSTPHEGDSVGAQ